MTAKEITRAAHDLASRVREYCRSQKETWQLVPSLALAADGRTGWSDSYSMAYHHGYWQIHASISEGYYQTCVDLATGELVLPLENRRTLQVEDQVVLPLSLHLNELDAQALVDSLRAQAQAPCHPLIEAYGAETQRARLRAELQIPERYVRT